MRYSTFDSIILNIRYSFRFHSFVFNFFVRYNWPRNGAFCSFRFHSFSPRRDLLLVSCTSRFVFIHGSRVMLIASNIIISIALLECSHKMVKVPTAQAIQCNQNSPCCLVNFIDDSTNFLFGYFISSRALYDCQSTSINILNAIRTADGLENMYTVGCVPFRFASYS